MLIMVIVIKRRFKIRIVFNLFQTICAIIIVINYHLTNIRTNKLLVYYTNARQLPQIITTFNYSVNYLTFLMACKKALHGVLPILLLMCLCQSVKFKCKSILTIMSQICDWLWQILLYLCIHQEVINLFCSPGN